VIELLPTLNVSEVMTLDITLFIVSCHIDLCS